MSYNIKFILLGFFLTALSFLLCVLLGIPITLNWIEFIAVATSYTCTILFMLQKRVAYVYGVVSTFFLCLFFFTQGIFALAIFNGILVVSLIYGYWRWGPDGKPIPVTRIDSAKSFGGYALFFLIVGALFMLIVGGGSKMDLGLAAASATAQLMLDNKKIENWIVWIFINVFSIIFFINAGFYLLAVQFAFFLINALVALYRWREDLKAEGIVANAV